MSLQPVVVHLTPDLYERIRNTAQQTNRSLELVLSESLALLFGGLADDVEVLLPVLNTLSDEQLWAIVQRRLAWAEHARLSALIAANRSRDLSVNEESELQLLLDQVDQYTLLRSKALLLLQQRGHNVKQHLEFRFC